MLLEYRRLARALPDVEHLDWLADWNSGTRVAGLIKTMLTDGRADPAGLKLGALESGAQRALGLTAPLAAPFYEEWLLEPESEIHLADFVAPRVECEIGFVRRGGRWVPTGCLEVADCRFPAWSATGGQVIADFALNGAMLFGDDLGGDTDTRFRFFHDGNLLVEGTVSVAAARARIRIPTCSLLPKKPKMVASGSLHPALPIAPGRWILEFDTGGTTTLSVLP